MIEKLLKLLKIKFAGEIPLKDGTMIRVDGDVAIGASVYVQSPDGEIPLPDGDYELETGEILSAKDGKIEAITSPVDTEETPDVTGAPPIGEVSVEIDAAIGENIPPVADMPVEKPEDSNPTPPMMEEWQKKFDDLAKRLDDLESKLNVKAELETKLETELEFIKSKTLVTELKKSKEINDAPLSRADVIRNLKNNK